MSNRDLEVNFLNVGNGSCTVIKHPSGRLTVVDIANGGNNPNKDLVDPIEFIKKYYPEKSVFRFILSHPDMDHMTGVRRLHEEVGITNFWDTDHNKKISDADFKSTSEKDDWDFYQQVRQSISSSLPGHHQYSPGSDYPFFGMSEDHDKIQILAPSRSTLNRINSKDDGNYNDSSYILRIEEYGISFLLPGDVEKLAWESVLEDVGERALRSVILLASHHGRDSGYHLEALKAISPVIIIQSVGEKPDTDAYSKLAYNADTVISTREHGTVRFTVKPDGEVVPELLDK